MSHRRLAGSLLRRDLAKLPERKNGCWLLRWQETELGWAGEKLLLQRRVGDRLLQPELRRAGDRWRLLGSVGDRLRLLGQPGGMLLLLDRAGDRLRLLGRAGGMLRKLGWEGDRLRLLGRADDRLRCLLLLGLAGDRLRLLGRAGDRLLPVLLGRCVGCGGSGPPAQGFDRWST